MTPVDPHEDDVRITLARVEGMLGQILPQHTAQLDEHTRAIAGISLTQVKHGERLASLETSQESHNRTPPWVSVVVMILAAAAINVTIILALIHK